MIEALRAWARRHTERSRYSPVGIAFHWVMAFLVLFQLGWGFWTDWMMPGGDKLAMVLDNGRVYDKNQPFAIVHGGWSKPLISVGSLLNAPPQPWFSQSGVRKGVFELTAEWRGFDFPWLLS